jgi:cyclophilin family peptidyl-prolyl cis-trans isomerase
VGGGAGYIKRSGHQDEAIGASGGFGQFDAFFDGRRRIRVHAQFAGSGGDVGGGDGAGRRRGNADDEFGANGAERLQ